MPTDQAEAIAARARRSFVAPRDLGHAAEGDELVLKINNDGHEVTKELLVLNTNGEWQPALSLFEYVQQSLVELCAGYIEASADKPRGEGWEEDECWYDAPHDAWRVYAEPVGLTRDDITDIDTLLCFVTTRVAAGIVKRRRKELASIRALRLVALRNQVPKDIVGHIESFFAPAKDSVPFRSDQLPSFMHSWQREYRRQSLENSRLYAGSSVSAGRLGDAEIWKGQFRGREQSGLDFPQGMGRPEDEGSRDWILLPKKFLQQHEEQPFVFSFRHDESEGWPAGAVDFFESRPGHRTYIVEDADGRHHRGPTFECIVLDPYFAELRRRAQAAQEPRSPEVQEQIDAYYRQFQT